MNRKTRTKIFTFLWIIAPSFACASPGEVDSGTPTASAQGPADTPRRRALLVGINDYSASDIEAPRSSRKSEPFPDGQRDEWPNLKGAVNDVDAMHDVLVGRFNFDDADVRVVKDQGATREAILQALREHLVEPARDGDVVVFYYSGHGSQVRNSKSEDRDKLDESIVPANSRLGAPDIRDKELRGLFNQVLRKGAMPVVVLDSCHSGSGVRGLADGARPRALNPNLRDVADGKDYGPPIEKYGALVLAAAQDDEEAIERHEEGRYYGAFTFALVKALRAASKGESSRFVFERVRGYLGAVGRYQRPVLEGLPARLAEPLFGPPSDGVRDGVVAVEKVWSDGRVDLLGGWIHGLDVGSELSRLGAESDEAPRLRVVGLDGHLRSHAEILEGPDSGPEVAKGQLFEVVSWVAKLEPLQVWVPRMEAADVALDLAKELAASAREGKLGWVEDPTERTPSHVLRWSGGVVELLAPGSRPRPLDAQTSADDVLRFLGGEARAREARLFVHLPAPASLLDELEVGTGRRHSEIEIVDDPGQATYLLAGRLRGDALEYAWIRPGSLLEDQEEVYLPARSAWIDLELSEPEGLATPIWKLEDRVLRLYKVFAWNMLQPDSEAKVAFPYRLAVADAGGAIIGDQLFSGRNYKLVLEKEDGLPVAPSRVDDRYVYAFAIDGEGASSLLYPPPHKNSENKFPGASAENGLAPGRIDLGEDSLFDVVEPYGFDTFFLFTSDEPIPDPWSIFQYEGVRGREPPRRGALATLLAEVGATKRGTRSVATTSRWSIEKRVYRTASADD